MALNQSQLSYKSNYLFPEEEMFPRLPVLKSEFESAFKPWIRDIIRAFREASKQYKEFLEQHPFALQRKSFSSHLWNFLITEQLGKIPGLNWDTLEGNLQRFYIKIDQTKLFVKKIDEHYNTKNIETAAVQQYREQLTNDINDKDPVLFLGYQLDDTRREIIDISIVCRKGDKLEWRIDVYKLHSLTLDSTSVIPITHVSDTPMEYSPKYEKLATVKLVPKEKRE